MSEEREPLALALIVCDGVHSDPGSGKKTLLGLFSVVIGPKFPFVVPQICIYAAITECIGPTTINVRIVDANEEREPVVDVDGKVECEDPLAVLDLAFFFGSSSFPEAGEYRVQLFAAGVPIMERRLMAIMVESGLVEGPNNV